jgi:hypothetical protein
VSEHPSRSVGVKNPMNQEQARGMSAVKGMPRWPLFLIAAPAAVAVWSGWVSLGGLCGFGVVHPLPGIVDGFTINTAITLPVGVEAYGAYALGAWLTPGASGPARRFAKWSAIGSLVLGMLGQVAYHLLAAGHATRAPWPVVTLVSCLPVVALALGTALAHLREPGEHPATTATPAPESTPWTAAETVPASASLDAPVGATETQPVSTPTPVAKATRGRTTGRASKRAKTGASSLTPETHYADELERGELPSLRRIQRELKLGAPKARQVREQLAAVNNFGQKVAA